MAGDHDAREANPARAAAAADSRPREARRRHPQPRGDDPRRDVAFYGPADLHRCASLCCGRRADGALWRRTADTCRSQRPSRRRESAARRSAQGERNRCARARGSPAVSDEPPPVAAGARAPETSLLWRRVCALGIAQIVSWGTLFYTIAVLGGAMRTELGVSDVMLFGSFTAGLLVSGLA